MPNAYTFRNPSPDPELPWDDRIQWDVPVDDEHSLEFRARLVPVTGETARQYQERRAALLAKDGSTTPELGQAVLSGKLRYDDLQNIPLDKIALVHTQDYVAQVGQGTISDRRQEHLGRSDVGVILYRKIWERELLALAEGRRIKKWVCPQDRAKEFEVGRQEKE
jgi:5,5'-dehydrodivanillate O-demethylase